MVLERTRRRIRVLQKGMVALTAVYKRSRDLRGVAAQAWFVTTRQGLVGLHDWLVVALPGTEPAIEAEPTVEAAEHEPPTEPVPDRRDL